jgi:hypothetical protein
MWSCPNLRYYASMCLKGVRKPMKKHVFLSGVMVIVPANGTKVCRFKTSQETRIFKGNKNL